MILYLYPSPYYPYGGITNAQMKLINHIRLLWNQHSEWTRMAIVSLTLDLPDADYAVNRLLRNPKDFAYRLKDYYGFEIGDTFAHLLTEHLVLAADLIKAQKSSDDKKAEEIEKKWYKNADEISGFLASINPYWNKEYWREMFYMHLDLVKAVALSLLNKNYEDSVSIYDRLESETLKMADIMADGIMRQFPYEFIR